MVSFWVRDKPAANLHNRKEHALTLTSNPGRPRFQEQFLSPDYVDSVLSNAEDSARTSVNATFAMLDADGDGEVSRAEFMEHAATGYHQLNAGPSSGPDRD